MVSRSGPPNSAADRADVRYCLLRSVIVSYSRPFSSNRGRVHRSHKLAMRFVPNELRSLHQELIDLRMRLFAHTDFSYRRPELAKFLYPTRTAFPLGFSQVDYPGLDRRVKQIARLVQGVADNLEAEIQSKQARLATMT